MKTDAAQLLKETTEAIQFLAAQNLAIPAEAIQMQEVFGRCVAAEAKVEAARVALREIVCTEGEDAGVVLLSQEGPTHYDKTLKCQVYDHMYFSPLGDALVKLWQGLQDDA